MTGFRVPSSALSMARRIRTLVNGAIYQRIMVWRKRKSWYIRQHLETCVFSYVAEELKTGDLCVAGSEQYADYRDQLLSLEECEPKLEPALHFPFRLTSVKPR